MEKGDRARWLFALPDYGVTKIAVLFIGAGKFPRARVRTRTREAHFP